MLKLELSISLMADTTIKSETSAAFPSVVSTTTAPNPMERSQITNSPVSPVNVQSAIVGGVVAVSDGTTVRVTIIEQVGVVPSQQLQSQGIATPANSPSSQYQSGSAPINFQSLNQQTGIPNQHQAPTTLPGTAPQSYQQTIQPTQPHAPQTYQQNPQTTKEPVREFSLSQAAIPSSTLPNQIQNSLAILFNSSQTANEPLPAQLLRLNQVSAANQQATSNGASAQEQNPSSNNEVQKQVTVTVEQTKDTVTTKTVETKTEPPKQQPESGNGDLRARHLDASQRETTVKVYTEPVLCSPQNNLSADALAAINKAANQANSNLATQPNIGSSRVEVRSNLDADLSRESDLNTRRNVTQDEQRINSERARNIQQAIIIDREIIRSSVQPTYENSLLSPSIKAEPTAIALERTKESIIEKLSAIQNRIELTPCERRRQIEIQGGIDNRIQGRDILSRPAEIPPSERRAPLSTRLADRIPDNKTSSQLVREPLLELRSASTPERPRIRLIDSSSQMLSKSANTDVIQATKHISGREDRLANLVDILKQFSQRSVNFKLLNKMDTSLEKACLTMVTGAALGIVGIGLTYKALNLALLHTLGFLREESASEIENEAVSEEHELTEQLEDFATTELNSLGDQGFVVDLAGIVLSAKRVMPIAYATVKCSEFGTCQTDTEGRFIFTNIPLGTPYTITVSADDLSLKPIVVSGVCGELEFLRIRVEEIGL